MPASTPRSDSPFEDPRQRIEAGRFGMWVFLVVLGVFFAAAMIAFAAIRIDLGSSPLWAGAGAPPLPPILYASTVVLVLVSGALEWSKRTARRAGNPRFWLWMALALGVGFLTLQSVAWIRLWSEGLTPNRDLFGWAFYVLTAIHALHVLGGLAALGWILGRRRLESEPPTSRASGSLIAMYWHFLAAAWIGLYLLLIWSSR